MISILGDVFLDKPIGIASDILGSNVVLNCEQVISDCELVRDEKIIVKSNSSFYKQSFADKKIYASVANNHTLDLGSTGFDDTCMHLRRDELDVFGQDRNNSVLIKDGNMQVQFFTWVLPETNPVYKDGLAVLPDFDLTKACQAIRNARLEGYNCVAYLHWGEEELSSPSSIQREIGKSLIDSGAFLVVGCHSHCIGEIESYKNGKIYYSLGNFYFPNIDSQYRERTGKIRRIVKKQRARNMVSIVVHIDERCNVSHSYVRNKNGYLCAVDRPSLPFLNTRFRSFERFRARAIWLLDNPWVLTRKLKRLVSEA